MRGSPIGITEHGDVVFRETNECSRSAFDANFDFGDSVSIDNGDQTGVVVGFLFYPHGKQVLVSWWNNGAIAESWLAEWRLGIGRKVKSEAQR